MSALSTFLTRVVVTVIALATVLLVFVVEPVMDPRGGASVLLLDRGRKARIGDRVVCTQKAAAPVVARVAGAAGQRVALKGNLLFVEGEPVERRPCRGEEARAFDKARAPRCFVERRGDRSWSVLAPPDGRQVDLDVRVPSASVYLLSDDRAAASTDSRGTGPRLRDQCRSVAVEVSMGGVSYRP
jgi:type IV secretory pathway protease TraF